MFYLFNGISITDEEEADLEFLKNRLQPTMSDEEMKTAKGVKELVVAAAEIATEELHKIGLNRKSLASLFWRASGLTGYVGKFPPISPEALGHNQAI